LFEKGRCGEKYNVGDECEKTNLEVVKMILKELNLNEDQIEHVEDRPGHDTRYAIDATKIKSELNWSTTRTFEEGLRETIQWYIENPDFSVHSTEKLSL
jgi:dTDP-glucose 4,6-dehydratase